MLSKNLSVFLMICAVFLISTAIGILRNHPTASPRPTQKPPVNVPCIGQIQVLNGFGADGAAEKAADFLRTNKYDVIHIGNAASWNYPFTLVVSRVKDMAVARQVAKTLNTDHLVMIRTEDRTYDVTVIIGPDYRKRIR